MKKGKDPMNVCQNCVHGNNEKGEWKKTWKRRGIHHIYGDKESREANKGKGYWHIFCEKKQKYYPWDGKKRCIERCQLDSLQLTIQDRIFTYNQKIFVIKQGRSVIATIIPKRDKISIVSKYLPNLEGVTVNGDTTELAFKSSYPSKLIIKLKEKEK
ncbi:MAG: hypothetical protein ACFFDN_00130 [Candidatus Hodarchaeota archaeon]